jgi:hypothetical protein
MNANRVCSHLARDYTHAEACGARHYIHLLLEPRKRLLDSAGLREVPSGAAVIVILKAFLGNLSFRSDCVHPDLRT